MPSHGIIPYEFSLHEFGDRDSVWSLNSLQEGDSTLPSEHIFDIFSDFLDEYDDDISTDTDDSKGFIVDSYNIDDDFVEGVIARGDYGYESVIRDISTGNETYRKSASEVELLPFYFLFWIPQTQGQEYLDEGAEAIMLFQQINGLSVKSVFQESFYQSIMDGTNSTLLMDPATQQNVLNKLINANRVKRAEYKLNINPTDTEGRMHLAEGMDTRDEIKQSIVQKPTRGHSLRTYKNKARELENDHHNFATVVSDDVSDLKVTIENEQGRNETFSLLDDELKMRKVLQPDSSELQNGLPTTEYVSSEMCTVVNDLYNQSVVQTLDISPSV